MLQVSVTQCEDHVHDHERYRELYHRSMEWLKSTKQKLMRLNDPTGTKEDLKEKLTNIQVKKILI